VAGLLGAEARMVPLRIGLNLGGKRILNFKYEIMDHPIITPSLAATVLAQTISTYVRGQGFQSLSLQGNIKLAGQPAVEIESMVADLSANRIASYLGAILQFITLNPFERPVIDGISLTVKAEERLDLTAIAGVRTLKARAKRGQALPVLVTLQNIQGVRETTTFNLFVPQSARRRPGRARRGDEQPARHAAAAEQLHEEQPRLWPPGAGRAGPGPARQPDRGGAPLHQQPPGQRRRRHQQHLATPDHQPRGAAP
jgi:hypothetical protein